MADLDQKFFEIVAVDTKKTEHFELLSQGLDDENSDNEILGLGNCETNSSVVKLIDSCDVSSGLTAKQLCQKYENKVDLGFYTKVKKVLMSFSNLKFTPKFDTVTLK